MTQKSIKEYRIISTPKKECEECKEGPLILIYNTLIEGEHLEGTFCLNCHEIKTFPKHECLTCKLEWREKRMNENLDRFLGIEDNGFCNNCPWKPGKDWIPWILDKLFNTIRFRKEYWIRTRGYWKK